MHSPLLALFTRSLREDARNRATYWARGGFSLFVLLVMAMVAIASFWVGAPGRNFFITVITLQFATISLLGLSYFTSAVAEEKEDQTLGLLRMTNLSPLAILLGKSTSRLCGALLLIAAAFPFTVFAVTLGGISLEQIFAAYCTVGAYTFLLCNVALLGSVVARRATGAAIFTMAVMGLFLTLGPLLQSLSKAAALLGLWMAPVLAEGLWNATPVARLVEVLSTGFSGSAIGWQVLSNLALGVGFFLLAWLAFGRFCERDHGDSPASPQKAGTRVPNRLARPPRPVGDAIVWKDFHFLLGGRRGVLIRSLGYGGSLLLVLVQTWPPQAGAWQFAFLSFPSFVFSLDVGIMASRIFHTEIRDRTLSSLAGLPLSVREIAYRKVRSCLKAALPGAICILLAAAILLASQAWTPRNGAMEAAIIFQMIGGWVSTALLVHIIARLSLAMKGGALPLGFVVLYVFSTFASIGAMTAAALINLQFPGVQDLTSGAIFTVVQPLLANLASLIAIVVLHQLSLRRLEVLVGES